MMRRSVDESGFVDAHAPRPRDLPMRRSPLGINGEVRQRVTNRVAESRTCVRPKRDLHGDRAIERRSDPARSNGRISRSAFRRAKTAWSDRRRIRRRHRAACLSRMGPRRSGGHERAASQSAVLAFRGDSNYRPRRCVVACVRRSAMNEFAVATLGGGGRPPCVGLLRV